ncbi:MAG: hypothetical protein LUC85_08595 [Bacteroidales bacterium]|nr:hypothetical protein [Bacteroidales bacterium]
MEEPGDERLKQLMRKWLRTLEQAANVQHNVLPRESPKRLIHHAPTWKPH